MTGATTTGFPRNSGFKCCSQEAKKLFRSTNNHRNPVSGEPSGEWELTTDTGYDFPLLFSYNPPGQAQRISALLKPIIAKAGDVVELTAAGIFVNARFVPNTAPLSVDTKHRSLEHFPYGRYVVPQGEVWVASSYNTRSFDSRYYGPVPVYRIREHLKPLLTL